MRSILAGVLFLCVAFAYCDMEGTAQLKRLQQDEGACLNVFQDASAPSVERRIAYRKLLEGTKHADATLVSALNDKDPVIRRNAVYVAFQRNMPGLFNTLKTLVEYEDFNVARMVLDCANQFPNAEQRTELLTLVSAYFGLLMFKFARIKSDLVNRKSPALKFWGAVRLFLLGTPLLLNTLLYYAYMKATFGYLALILALCLPFVYPSKDRCLSETEDDVAEDKTPEEAS